MNHFNIMCTVKGFKFYFNLDVKFGEVTQCVVLDVHTGVTTTPIVFIFSAMINHAAFFG